MFREKVSAKIPCMEKCLDKCAEFFKKLDCRKCKKSSKTTKLAQDPDESSRAPIQNPDRDENDP